MIYDYDVAYDVASGLMAMPTAPSGNIGQYSALELMQFGREEYMGAGQPSAIPSLLPVSAGLDFGRALSTLGQAKVVVPAVAGALGLTMPAWLVALLGIGGVAAGGYGALQALGLGEGAGLFGMDILGGPAGSVDGIPLVGPGAAEPPANITLRHWKNGGTDMYLVIKPGTTRRWVVSRSHAGKYNAWPMPRPHLAVIGKNMPRHQMLTRLRHNLSRHSADARTILKVTSPRSLSGGNRNGHHGVRRHKRG